jgi:transposase
VVVADECRIQQEPNPFYRWSKKGETPIISVNRKRQSVSIYGGLSLRTNRIITHWCDWQNSLGTIQFLNMIKKRWQQLKRGRACSKPILVVWDNVRFHKSKEVKQWLRENDGVVELMNFPPYSPELNPQEKVWKALKKYLADILARDTFEVAVERAREFLKNGIFPYKFV